MNNQNLSIGIFHDLSKVFDIINHSLLLKKLENIYGIRDNALHWISNYHSERAQCVSFGSVLSKAEKIMLESLLLVLYINDIVNVSTILKLMIFADDTNVYVSHKNAYQLI